LFNEQGRFSGRNLHYAYMKYDPFAVPREVSGEAKLPSIWTDEQYQAVEDLMKEIKRQMEEGHQRILAYCKLLGFEDELISLTHGIIQTTKSYRERHRWGNHLLWSMGKDIDAGIGDEIEEIDFQIAACLTLLPTYLVPTHWIGVLYGPRAARFNHFFSHVFKSLEEEKGGSKGPTFETIEFEDVELLDRSPEEPSATKISKERVSDQARQSTKLVINLDESSCQQEQLNVVGEGSTHKFVLPWAATDGNSQQHKRQQLSKMQELCEQVYDKGPRNQQIWIEGDTAPIALSSEKLKTKDQLKPRQVHDLIPPYEPKMIRGVIKFAEKCGRAFQNKNVPPIYLDEVISTRLEDTEAERTWYENWRATNPKERQDFDTAFKRMFLPPVTYNLVIKKCSGFVPDPHKDVVAAGNDLRAAIRPYIRLLHKPHEQMQAEAELLDTYRGLIGPAWSTQISMADNKDIDSAIQTMMNYKIQHPGDMMSLPGVYIKRRNPDADPTESLFYNNEKGQRGKKENQKKGTEKLNTITTLNPMKKIYHCDFCNIDGHSTERCIKRALSQGKITPDGYICRTCQAKEQHLARDCPKQVSTSTTKVGATPSSGSNNKPAATEFLCYRCGGKGHMSRDCATPKGEQPRPQQSGN
jgi:hypothetical protein